ncbi:MAG: 2-phosphosulfolactate phosphatase [Flavobacteriales bacterium]|nr:2-phosphosulfolactate phosphatase [Flavobacteriales bacterium]
MPGEGKNDVLVSYTPANFPYYEAEDAIVVVIDILRATSAICAAFINGVARVIPVKTVEEAIAYREKGYLAAAERNGEKVPGFDMGNSPYDFLEEDLKGKEVVLTTTNGTQALAAASGSHKVVVGSFLNLSALCKWLIEQDRKVVLLCAGWKNKYNMEDSIYAGAVVGELLKSERFSTTCDSAIAASHIFGIANYDLYRFLDYSSHRIRLRQLQLEKDIRYCLQRDITDIIPILEGDALVPLRKAPSRSAVFQ